MVCFLTHNFLECIYIYIYTEEDRMGETSVINHIKKFVSNSWGKHKGKQYHDGDLIPDKTYWPNEKEYWWTYDFI